MLKVILCLSSWIALWDLYYMHLVWENIENDLNRIVDFFNKFMGFFSNFINVLAMVLTIYHGGN